MHSAVYDDEGLQGSTGDGANEQTEDVHSLRVPVDHDGLGQTDAITLENLILQPNIRSKRAKSTGIMSPKA